jgi:uncharacterized protein
VYFGENFGGFAVVKTKVSEVEPTGRETEKETTYTGKGGVPASSFVRKAALALRFGSWDLFVSGQLTDQSRVIYNRDIRARVQTAAPFLRFDADPYPVALNGRIVWMIDGYTTTDRYPYSQSIRPEALPPNSGLDTTMNYVRNSVKATVDAYDGSVHFYVVDESDPLVRAYRKAFPNLFDDADTMPAGLKEHWRYPEDIYRTQTEHYATYHMTDAREFYNKADLWDVAPEPSAAGVATQQAASSTSVAGNNGGRNNTLSSSGNPITPLYQMMELPGESGQEFILQRSFVPRGKPNQLTAFMAARNDPAHYGQLIAYNTPNNSTAPSPTRAATLIESEQRISSQLTLLDQRGSEVLRGAVQLLPINDSVIYIRPIWLKGQGGSSFPRFRFVAMTYGEQAVLADSVDDGVRALFGNGPITPPNGGEEQPPPNQEPGGKTPAQLLAQASDEFDAADAALQRNDLGGYQDHIEKAQGLVSQALDLINNTGGSTTSTTSTTVPGATTTTTAPRSTTTTGPGA